MTLVDVEAATLAIELENTLQACLMLQYVDVTWQTLHSLGRGLQWDAIGAALTRYGSNLHKIKLDNFAPRLSSAQRPDSFLNLASLSHLRSLTLPVEAILQAPEGDDNVSATYEAIHSGVHTEDGYGHAPRQGVNTPTVPLSQLFPPSIMRLRITDDWGLWVDAVRLDMELRKLVLNPRFPDLRSIHARRKIPWSRHVKDLNWHRARRVARWNILSRSQQPYAPTQTKEMFLRAFNR